MSLIYGSVCSGIESASIAWEPLGMRPAWFAEVEPFPSAVLAHHWPTVGNLGDMTTLPGLVAAGAIEAPDILVGGTPCQAFSVAGLRKGLDDERGQLTLKFVELANEIDRKRPGNECVVVWENVPGVLSSRDNAFGCFLAALVGEYVPLEPAGKKWSNAGCVHGPERTVAWRILDAQYFGVAQRRRRVFVVASARKGFSPGAVLFESEGLRRDTPPSREAAPAVAALTANGVGTCGASTPQSNAIYGFQPRIARNGRGDMGDISHTLNAQSGQTGKGDSAPCIAAENLVRRLTPIECERLQGFPDNHTRIPWKGKLVEDCPDGPRYKAIGNSKAVPVIKFVGERVLRELQK